MRRNRWIWLLAFGGTIVLGLASRRYEAELPRFLGDYAGDTLWALMVFWGVGLLAPRWPSRRVAGCALIFSYAIELSQLYHAPWIDSLRRTGLGRLVLGFGFLWSDLLCYTAGIALGVLLEAIVLRLADS